MMLFGELNLDGFELDDACDFKCSLCFLRKIGLFGLWILVGLFSLITGVYYEVLYLFSFVKC